MPLSVLIIGAGNIGACFDTPQSEMVLSHAHAFVRHPGFVLSGFVDADHDRCVSAANVWGGMPFKSTDSAFQQQNIDVAVVAVPDECHYSLLKELANYPLKLVVAEKPLTKSLSEAEEILRLYRDKGISLAVNYTRRFVPDFVALREHITSGEFGKYLTGTGYYGKGTLHNGSHMIDLLGFLVGEIKDIQSLSTVHDFYHDDPSRSLHLTLENGAPFFMQAVDCRCYTIFEFDLFFERKRIRLTDSGVKIETYDVKDNALFAGYRNLEKVHVQETSIAEALTAAVTNFHDHLVGNAPLLCTGVDGYKVMTVCCRMMETPHE